MSRAEYIVWPLFGLFFGGVLSWTRTSTPEQIEHGLVSASPAPVQPTPTADCPDLSPLEEKRDGLKREHQKLKMVTRMLEVRSEHEEGKRLDWPEDVDIDAEETQVREDVVGLCEGAEVKTQLVETDCSEWPCLAMVASPMLSDGDPGQGVYSVSTALYETQNGFAPISGMVMSDDEQAAIYYSVIGIPQREMTKEERIRVSWRIKTMSAAFNDELGGLVGFPEVPPE